MRFKLTKWTQLLHITQAALKGRVAPWVDMVAIASWTDVHDLLAVKLKGVWLFKANLAL